eukprot:CAMPEP_0202960728 /NCGR_PEP_ID=MMETSP1396-20130829/4880_1 /ASSEMBLY_ACC=CAM_ASM_000872 /TAXON_ID= /ORGANISM="Pseudokeronopsis sp., Strain Brazil" /LENGTH=87 /DNA_ID=CAMNT_0049680133 /DNA_START=572 /DNA_END=834 /DNA_ORIENTATION=-
MDILKELKHAFYKEFFNPDGALKGPEALRKLYEEKGIDLSKPIVTNCNTGVTASIHLAILKSLGLQNISLYDGSWSEYSKNKVDLSQ